MCNKQKLETVKSILTWIGCGIKTHTEKKYRSRHKCFSYKISQISSFCFIGIWNGLKHIVANLKVGKKN